MQSIHLPVIEATLIALRLIMNERTVEISTRIRETVTRDKRGMKLKITWCDASERLCKYYLKQEGKERNHLELQKRSNFHILWISQQFACANSVFLTNTEHLMKYYILLKSRTHLGYIDRREAIMCV